MATPKSANERIRRKLRKKKTNPSEIDMPGRVQAKKQGNNDPRRNRPMSEEFLKFYRGDQIEKPNRFCSLIDKMIDIAVEAGGKANFPFKINRLQEMRESVTNSGHE